MSLVSEVAELLRALPAGDVRRALAEARIVGRCQCVVPSQEDPEKKESVTVPFGPAGDPSGVLVIEWVDLAESVVARAVRREIGWSCAVNGDPIPDRLVSDPQPYVEANIELRGWRLAWREPA